MQRGVLECDTRLRPFVPLRIMSHKLRYTVTASFGGYFWSLMMVLVSVVSSLREGNIVSALAICVAWTHMNWAASRRLLSTPTTSCQGHCHRTRLVLQVDLDFWQFFTKIWFWALQFYLVVFERAHFSSNSSFVKLQNFKFKHIASSSFFHFSSLRLSLEMSFPSFGPNISSISSFIEFEFALNTNHRARVWSSLKIECLNSSSFRF